MVFLIISGLVIGFSAMVYHAFTHSRGEPVAYVEPDRETLEIVYLDKDIDLSQSLSPELWEPLKAQHIGLMYQVTVLPWPKDGIANLSIKTFHNKKDIFFYLSWKDDLENRAHGTSEFSDACAIMFPLEEQVKPTSIMMGFMEKTNIWQWKAQQDEEYWDHKPPTTESYIDFYYPFEETELFPVSQHIPVSAVNNLLAIRVGTITPKENQDIQGRGFWKEGTWSVVFRRSLKSLDPEVDTDFDSATIQYCAFGIWDGDRGDRGGRKSISNWVSLALQ